MKHNMSKDDLSKFISKDKYNFNDFLKIMEMLREQCPWDREQTHDSLKRYMIEEAYEVLEAIDKKSSADLSEELGDLLLQIVFHASIAAESGAFDMSGVITGVSKKMISRHPHVFGDVKVNNSDDVLTNWEQIKRDEKGLSGVATAMKKIPSNLPALMRAYKIQQKAADVGFDWDDIYSVYMKVDEEFYELREAWDSGDRDAIAAEMGDMFFALVNLSRFMHVHPELAATASTEKFITRFELMESIIKSDNKSMDGMTLSEMDVYWERAKTELQ